MAIAVYGYRVFFNFDVETAPPERSKRVQPAVLMTGSRAVDSKL